MSETFDTGLDLDEDTEGCDLRYGSLNDVADVIALLEVCPGIFLHVLEREVDLLCDGIDVDESELDDLTLLDEILGSCDVAPGHVVDVKKSVETAEVDECAEGCEGLDLTLNDIADLDRAEELLLVLLDDALKVFPSGNDALELGACMELVDHEVVGLADE